MDFVLIRSIDFFNAIPDNQYTILTIARGEFPLNIQNRNRVITKSSRRYAFRSFLYVFS